MHKNLFFTDIIFESKKFMNFVIQLFDIIFGHNKRNVFLFDE